MSSLKPDEPANDWTQQTAAQRFNTCRVMLYIHGFISDAEKARIDARIDKWLAAKRPAPAHTEGQ